MKLTTSRRWMLVISILVLVLTIVVGALTDVITRYFPADVPLIPLIIAFVVVVLLLVGFSAYLSSREEPRHPPEVAIPGSISVAAVMSNLPARGQFIGREPEKARVLEGLTQTHWPLVLIQGPAGIGKTALAREVAWMLRDRPSPLSDNLPRFDAIIWTEDHDGQLTLGELLNTIGRVLEQSTLSSLPESDRQMEAVKLLQSKKCLIVVDNIDTVSDVDIEHFLKRIPSPISRAIITSRKKLLQDDSWVISLEKMEMADRLALAHSEVKRLSPALEQDQSTGSLLKQLCELTEGDPYTIRVRVGQIQAGVSLQLLLDNAHTAHTDDERLRPSWDALATTQSAKPALMGIAMFQSPPSMADVKTVSGLDGDDLVKGLSKLGDLFLLETSDVDGIVHYGLHSITKGFAERKLEASAEYRQPLRSRMAQWAENYTRSYGGPKNWQGYLILDKQYSTLLKTVEWCSQQSDVGEKQRAITIWRAIDYYLSVRGDMTDYAKLGNWVLECAKAVGDREAEVDVKVGVLGFAYITENWRKTVSGHGDEALAERARSLVSEGLRQYEDSGNWAGAGTANRYLGVIAQQQGNLALAAEYFEKSLAKFERIPGWDNLGAVLGALGILALQRKDLQAAFDYQTRRKSLAEAMGDPEGMAAASYNLGRLAAIQGNDQQANDCYSQALVAAHKASRNDVIAASQRRLAAYSLKRGDSLAEAYSMAQAAFSYYDRAGQVPEAEELRDLLAQLDTARQKRPARLTRLVRAFLVRRS